MAGRAVGKLARLTLFSGPSCSLCDVRRLQPALVSSHSLTAYHPCVSKTAKAELAKVRQQRPFNLETINIQDAGQERWKRKYVYWIPALHIEGKEVAKGRWDAQTVNEALDAWERDPWTKDSPAGKS